MYVLLLYKKTWYTYLEKFSDAESTRGFLIGGISFPEKGRFSPTTGLPHLELFAL